MQVVLYLLIDVCSLVLLASNSILVSMLYLSLKVYMILSYCMSLFKANSFFKLELDLRRGKHWGEKAYQ